MFERNRNTPATLILREYEKTYLTRAYGFPDSHFANGQYFCSCSSKQLGMWASSSIRIPNREY